MKELGRNLDKLYLRANCVIFHIVKKKKKEDTLVGQEPMDYENGLDSFKLP